MSDESEIENRRGSSSQIEEISRASAFAKALQIFDFKIANNNSINLSEHLEKLRPSILKTIEKLINKNINIKVWIVQEVDYSPVLDPEAIRHAYL